MNMRRKINRLLKIIAPIFLWIHACSPDPKLSDQMQKMKTVKDKILNGYDKTLRPTSTENNKTTIFTAVLPRQILDVDEEKGIFELDSYVILDWFDPRLTWDLTEYDGNIQLPPDLLWLPDITIFNSHSAPIDPTQKDVLLYLHNGSVTWIPPMHTSTSCPSLLRVTHSDEEVTCGVQIGSWTHRGHEVELNYPVEMFTGVNEFVNVHSRWELLLSDVNVTHYTIYYQGYDESFYYLEYLFPLRRRPPAEIEVTRNPCILVILLTLAMFWMPPDSSSKLMVGGISFLALTTLLIYVACSTKFPLRVLIEVSFLQSTMYIVVVSILLQALVIAKLCNIPGPARPPAVLMQLLRGSFGKYMCLRSTPSNDNISTDIQRLKEDSQNFIKQPTPNEDWILFASGLDRLFFVLMSISMIAVHHV